MKKITIALLFMLISLLSFSNEKEKLVVAMLSDGISEVSANFKSIMEDEIRSLIGTKYDVLFPEDKQVVDSFNKEDISKKLDALLDDDECDIIITMGILSSYISLEKGDMKKPVFSPFVLKEILPKIKDLKSSNIKNLNYITSDLNLIKQMESFQQINVFNNLTVIIDKETLKIMPAMKNLFDIYTGDYNMNIKYVTIDEDINFAMEKIKDSQAIFMTPIHSISKEKKNELIEYINTNKIPSFSIFSSEQIENGVLAGYSYEKEIKKRIRAMAINISFYLEGQKVEDLPVVIDSINPELIINMKTVEKTGIWPSWEILSEAKLINFISDKDSKNAISLENAINISLENNPSINALKKELDLGKLNVKKAKTNYKPDITANITGAVIDEDRAESMLTQSEQTLNAGVTLTQIIFSEDANMNIDVNKEQMKLKEEELKKAELDLVLETGEAYFTVLKAEAYARIQKINIEMTKKNLEIAKNKKSAGISGASDIYRWESELANSISSLIESMVNVNLAKTNLKRIMNYNLLKKIEIKDIDLLDKSLPTSNQELIGYISNQSKVDIFSAYLIENMLINSPELKMVEYGINIQERLVKNANNKRFMPTVAFQANYTKSNIISEGAGSSSPDFSSLSSVSDSATRQTFGNLIGAFGNPDEDNWSVGLSFSLPIYSGGEIKADKDIALSEVEKLSYQKESITKGMEQQVISSLLKVVSEYSKIKNAEISSDSAKKALNLVNDAYSRGVVSITDLMSAQTASISAEQYKATVMYDLMTAIMRTERSVGSFYILKDQAEKEDFVNDLTDLESRF
jgi:outer membrane protein TolC